MKAQVFLPEAFLKAFKKLPPHRQQAVRDSIRKFGIEPATPGLRFRSLQGAPGYFIINGAHGDRIILRREDETSYSAVDAGPHDNVLRRWNR